MTSKNKCYFNIDDVLTPVLAYAKRDGQLLCCNKPAQRLLGFKAAEKIKVEQWRGGHRKSRSKSAKRNFADLGIVPHFNKKGEEHFFRVLEKSSTYNGKPCYINWITDITEYVKAERVHTNFYEAITSASIVSLTDNKGRITYANKNFIKASGYSKNELLGRDHAIINSGFHPKKFWKEMWNSIFAGKTWRAEVKNKTRNGSYYWTDTFIMPFVDEEGKLIEFISIQNDITSRKKSEEVVLQANEQLSETLIFGKMGSAELDLKTLLLTMSKELLLILEIDSNQPQTFPFESFLKKFVDASFIELIQSKVGEGLSGKETVEAEFEMITAKGKRIWIEARGFFKSGTAVGILHDVTDRKNREAQLQKRVERENLILSSTLDAIVGINDRGEIVVWNKQAEKIFGYPREEAIGKMMHELIVPENYHQAHASGMTHLIATGEGPILNKRIEIEAINKDENIFPIEMTIVAIGEAADRFFCAFIQDISERKQAQLKVIREREQLNSIINSLPGIFYLFDEQGKFLKWNKNFEKVSEYTEDEVAHMSPIDFFRPSEKEVVAERIMKVFTEGKADVEANFLTKSNAIIPYYFNGFASSFEGKRCLIGMGLDLTDLRKAEDDSRKKLRLIEIMINGVTDGFFATDSNLNLTLVSPVFERDVNKNAEEVIGTSILEVIPSLKGSHFIGLLQDSIRTSRPVTLDYTGVLNPEKIFSVNVYPNEDGLFAIYKDVSEEKHAENEIKKSQQALHQSEANLQTVLSNTAEGYILLDQDLNIKAFNANAFDFTQDFHGKELENGLDFFSLFTPSRQEGLRKVIDHVMHGQNIRYEVETKKADKARYFETSYVPVFESGQLIGVLLTLRDITQHKLAEKLIEERNHQLRTISENIPNGAVYQLLITNGGARKFLYVGSGFEKITGVRVDDILEDAGALYLKNHPLDADLLIQKENSSWKDLSVFECEFRFIRPDDKIVWINTRSTPRKVEEGVLFEGLMIDITDKKKIEKENERLAMIASHTSNSVFITDEEANIEWVNSGFEAITGYQLYEAKGKKPYELLAGQNTSAETMAELYKSIQSKKSVKVEILGYRKSGEECWLNVEALPIKDANGKINGFIGMQSDITSLKLAINEMLVSQNRLVDALKEKEMLIKEIHHRVKNNLQLISSILYIRSNKMPKNEMRNFLEDMRQRIKSIALVHERLLQTGKINQLDIKDYLQGIIADIEMTAINQECKLKFVTQIDSLMIDLDTAIYCGLIMNELVTNSLKHAFAGKIEGEIRISFRKIENKTEFVVEDNGNGFNPGTERDINTSFGMQLLEALAKQLKAEVIVEAQRGTKFKLYF